MSYPFCWLMVAVTILFNVYGQIVTKWQVLRAGALPPDFWGKFLFLFRLAFNPWMLTVFLGLFLTALCWMAALSRLPLSIAYPFTSLSFVLILVLSALIFNEPLNPMKLAGIGLVIAGLILSSQG